MGFCRIFLALLVGMAIAVLTAVVITILNIYLSGHGYEGLTQEYLTWSAAVVHLSIGDIVMLGAALLGATLTWKA